MLRALIVLLLAAGVARAQETPKNEAPPSVELPPAPAEYTPPPGGGEALHIGGYIDVGAAKAQGDGTSWADEEERLPVDYAADTFAPAVNSRGDVASTQSKEGHFTNGFLPHSMGIGGHASAFVNTASLDVRYQPEGSKAMAFVRLQLLPRVTILNVNDDRFLLQQAFVRLIPFESQEFALTVGRFDSVVGIEYLDNEAPIRIGITPSLVARYTTGWQLGAKAFYRLQFPGIWSALSINAAVTTNTPLVDALQPSAISLSGRPVTNARLGYELNHPKVLVKLGVSGAVGPRTDQTNPDIGHQQWGADARLVAGWLTVAAEVVHVSMEEGGADKVGPARLVSAFDVTGGYVFVGLGVPLPFQLAHKLTPYARYDRRVGGFTNFVRLDTDRITGGVRLDVGEQAALKAEYLRNRELSGAANSDNDVMTSSFVYYF